jgi:hypothetical protein
MHHLNKRRRIAEKVEGGGNKKIEKKDYGEAREQKKRHHILCYFQVAVQ